MNRDRAGKRGAADATSLSSLATVGNWKGRSRHSRWSGRCRWSVHSHSASSRSGHLRMRRYIWCRRMRHVSWIVGVGNVLTSSVSHTNLLSFRIKSSPAGSINSFLRSLSPSTKGISCALVGVASHRVLELRTRVREGRNFEHGSSIAKRRDCLNSSLALLNHIWNATGSHFAAELLSSANEKIVSVGPILLFFESPGSQVPQESINGSTSLAVFISEIGKVLWKNLAAKSIPPKDLPRFPILGPLYHRSSTSIIGKHFVQYRWKVRNRDSGGRCNLGGAVDLGGFQECLSGGKVSHGRFL